MFFLNQINKNVLRNKYERSLSYVVVLASYDHPRGEKKRVSVSPDPFLALLDAVMIKKGFVGIEEIVLVLEDETAEVLQRVTGERIRPYIDSVLIEKIRSGAVN